MGNLLSKLWKNEEGNIGVLGAIGVPVVMGAAALAIESTSLHGQYASLQSALDAAVLSAALVEPEQYNRIATEVFDYSLMLNNVTNTNVSVTRDGDILVAKATGTIDTYFGGILFPPSVDVSAVSRVGFSRKVGSEAEETPEVEEVGTRACIIVLQNNNEALRLNSNSSIIAPECEVHVHSTRDRPATGDSNQHNVSKFCLAGSRPGNNNADVDFTLNCDVAPDPYAGTLPTTIPNGCVTQPQNINGNTPLTLTPGRYCQGINVNGQADIHFEPGTYYIMGNWNVNGGKWTGDGVTFVYGQNGNIQFNSNFGGMKMSAPTTGDYANLLIVDTNGQNQYAINSGNVFDITGAVYMPRREFIFNSNSHVTVTANFVVGRMTINSNAVLNIDAASFMPQVPGVIYDDIRSANVDLNVAEEASEGEDIVRVASSEGIPYLIQ